MTNRQKSFKLTVRANKAGIAAVIINGGVDKTKFPSISLIT